MGEWKKYFMKLSGGVEHKVVKESKREREGKDVEEDIGRKEIRRAIRKLKDGKQRQQRQQK